MGIQDSESDYEKDLRKRQIYATYNKLGAAEKAMYKKAIESNNTKLISYFEGKAKVTAQLIDEEILSGKYGKVMPEITRYGAKDEETHQYLDRKTKDLGSTDKAIEDFRFKAYNPYEDTENLEKLVTRIAYTPLYRFKDPDMTREEMLKFIREDVQKVELPLREDMAYQVDPFWKSWYNEGRPDIRVQKDKEYRPNYTTETNTLNLSPPGGSYSGEEQDGGYFAELSHAQQWKNNPFDSEVRLRSGVFLDDSRDPEQGKYGVHGELEHDAHNINEPSLRYKYLFKPLRKLHPNVKVAFDGHRTEAKNIGEIMKDKSSEELAKDNYKKRLQLKKKSN